MATLTDDVRPLHQVLVMAAEGAYPDGILPSVLPGEVHAYAIVDYNFMWIELLRLYHDLTERRLVRGGNLARPRQNARPLRPGRK